MLGLGDSKNNAPAGAREKQEIAKKLRDAGRFNVNQQGGGGDIKYPSQTAVVALIFVISTVLAMILTDGKNNPFSGMHITGYSPLDNFIGGTDIAHFTGDPDEDRVITMVGRGAAFFVLSGLVPLISFGLEKLLFYKRVRPLLISWGVIIIGLLINLCIPLNEVIPFFKELLTF